MSKKLKRQRKKLERAGKRNPEWNRGTWEGKKLHTQLTPTLIGTIRKKEKKHKPNYLKDKDNEGSSVYLLIS